MTFNILYSHIINCRKKVMKHIYAILALALFVAGNAVAQNRNSAKKLFQQGDYTAAKPMFRSLLKKSPNNAEYSYWYAVCCLETGDTVDVVPLLELAASHDIVNANRYLGDHYSNVMDYPSAMECYGDFIDDVKDDSLRARYQRRLTEVTRLNRMVMNCAKVCVIDSFVVEKSDFLSVYNIGAEAGTVAAQAAFFDDASLVGHVYSPERGMDLYFSDRDEDDGLLKLYRNSRVGDEWGRAERLEGFETGGNDDYPFMLSDGVTLYFASDGEGSIGGYDLFVARFDTEDGRFLRPDNLGMPFNSTANDYMLAINEVANLGWFASDRNQPDSLVCVYLFVPNGGSVKYDASLGYDVLLSRAMITSIADTQEDEEVVRKATQQFALIQYSNSAGMRKNEFLFVIDDSRDYSRLSDFRSERAREMFTEWRERREAHEDNIAMLERKRDQYASATGRGKAALSEEILSLEHLVENEQVMLLNMEREIRRIEQDELYR